MGKIIANVVIKGGGAKTTSSLNIAYGLSKEGFRTILIDMDSSANASKTLMIKEKLSDDFVEIFQNKYDELKKDKKDIANYMLGAEALLYATQDKKETVVYIENVIQEKADVHEAIRKTKYKNLDVIPSSDELAGISEYLMRHYKMQALKNVTDILRKEYDYIIIDNAPVESALMYNVFNACHQKDDTILIPIKTDRDGLSGVANTIDRIHNWYIKIVGMQEIPCDIKILATMKNRNKLEDSVVQTAHKVFGKNMYHNTIRYQAKPIIDASLEGKILLECTASNVKKDYENLLKEILKKS